MITEAIRSDWAGRVMDGRFTLLQWLGGSELSAVFLTELPGPGSRKAAIKLIPADAGDEEARIAGWAAASRLSHPHLMRLLHFGSCQIGNARLLYTVTEYAEEILSEILPARPLTPAETAQMLDPVLDALSYLHGKGIVHGGLKPSNIMAVDDQLKLSSDSLHFAGQPIRRHSAQGVYDAPESAAGAISPAADLWSLGVTLVEALTQHPPLWERSREPEPLVPESIPQPLAGIVRECLRTDPERRCTLGGVKARLSPARFFLGPISKIGGILPAKLRWPALAAFAVIVIAGLAFLRLQPHPVAPQSPTEGAQPALGEPPSPPPATPNPKGVALKGAVAERVPPDVPQKARDTITGQIQVRVRVEVDPSGNVSNAALDSPASSKYFANLALEAARHWRFKPPQVDGQAVSSVWNLRFQFTRAATEATPVEVSPYGSSD